MSKLYFFYCRELDQKFAFFEYQRGWIDESGNIGHHLTIDGKPDGDVKGNWSEVIQHNALCKKCNRIFLLIIRDVDWQINLITNESLHPIELQDTEINYVDGEIPGHKIFKVDVICPTCKTKLLTGSQLVERAKLTKESRLLGLKPKDTIGRTIKCPLCNKSELEFDYAIRYG